MSEVDNKDSIDNSLDSPYCAYLHAHNVLKGRYREGEELMSTDYYASYLYALDIGRGNYYADKSLPG